MATDVTYRHLEANDARAVSRLHELVFGPGRFARAAYRVRERNGLEQQISPFCRAAFKSERLVASVTLTPVSIGATPGYLLLGPLAVDPVCAGLGYGRKLVADVIEAARDAGVTAIVLVGDLSYYGRFGFKPLAPGQIAFPGPVDQCRILGLELLPGAMTARGVIVSA